MNHHSPISVEAFDKALTPEKMKTLYIVSIAISMGVLTFCGIVIALSTIFQVPSPKPEDEQFIQILSGVHGLVALGIYGILFFIEDLFLKKMPNTPANLAKEPGERMVGVFIGFHIFRMGLMEASAIVGLVVCLLAATKGILQQYPYYWGNAVTTVIFFGFTIQVFPTRQKILDTFVRKFSRG